MNDETPLQIVQVNLERLGIKPHDAEVAILCNRSLREILGFHAAHPRCFVFMFYTKRAKDVPDNLGDLPDDYHFIQPCYVGETKKPRETIERMMDVAYETMRSLNCVTINILVDDTLDGGSFPLSTTGLDG